MPNGWGTCWNLGGTFLNVAQGFSLSHHPSVPSPLRIGGGGVKEVTLLAETQHSHVMHNVCGMYVCLSGWRDRLSGHLLPLQD